ncbi:MAG: NAD-dependent epimerase/dehydratase family protein [Bacillales bacterium]|nr:NAD-dependent epimerase/dehydratase family protein [Bacillales bacterium]
MNEVIALTGITGSMGSEVIIKLMESPYNFRVRAVIFEKEKRIPSYVKKVLKKYKNRIYAFYGDIAKYEDCIKLLDGASYCIHCGAMIPPKSDHNSEQTYFSNYVGTKNLVDAIIEKGNNIKFVNISTVAVYGNRSYPHFYGRVGDPVISSDYDNYSMYKIKAERYVLESGLNHFVSLRQTGILHKSMFTNNLKDGLMFHTSWNCVLEWTTDLDSAVLCNNLVERDLQGKLDGFWQRVYNIGGGESSRFSGYETLDTGFSLLGRSAKEFFKPNWNAYRNFHGMWYLDSDELNDYLDFRHETFNDYWKRMKKKYWYFSLGRILPPSWISFFAFKRLFKNTNAPMYWVNNNIEGRIVAFYGSKEKFDEIGTDWSKFNLFCEGKLPDGTEIDYPSTKNKQYAYDHNLVLSHGYDESKSDNEIDYDDLEGAAIFRGGHCLSKHFKKGSLFQKVAWECHEGHRFESNAFTILKGGYWCPLCAEPKPWKYGVLAKNSPFYAQIYYDTHTKEEEDYVYPFSKDEDNFIED